MELDAAKQVRAQREIDLKIQRTALRSYLSLSLSLLNCNFSQDVFIKRIKTQFANHGTLSAHSMKEKILSGEMFSNG